MIRTCWPTLLLSALVWSCSEGDSEITVIGADSGITSLCSEGGSEGDVRCLGAVEQVCTAGIWLETPTDNCRGGFGGGNGGGDLCFQAAAARSYQGCEYWPVDLDNAVEVLGLQEGRSCPDGGEPVSDLRACTNGRTTAGECDYGDQCPAGFRCENANICALDAQRSPFAVVVANPQDDPVDVRLVDSAGNAHQETVAPGEVATIFPQQLGFPDRSLNHSGISANAYKLNSTAPIVAYQFNPLDNVDVFSNDGSLLIPQHAYDGQYLAMSLPTLTRRPNTNDYNSYVSVVASAEGETVVEVIPSAAVRAGDRVEALRAGQTYTFTLQQFEVLNLEAAAGEDMTGTRVTSPDGAAFGMFVGHEAIVLQSQQNDTCCADHIEEQLFPISTWGNNFALARTEQRRREPDLVRILAHRPNTRITFDPRPQNTDCGVLAAGEHCDALIAGDTQITADNPVLVGHILMSTDGAAGDPAIAFAVPVEQFRTDYTFLVPQQYDEQYISVVARQGAEVRLDGQDIGGQLRNFGPLFAGGRIRVQPGQRRLECPTTCGVLVYGYSVAVSYLFAGGLDLEKITVP